MITQPPEFKRTRAVLGECYHNCWRFAVENPTWRVAHGVAVGQGAIAGVSYGHAWCEKGGWVYDPTADALLPEGLYYLAGQIKMVRRYSAKQVLKLSVRHMHSGPWNKKIARAYHSNSPQKNIL